MPAQFLSLSFGQAGVNLGDETWRQYCSEHGIELNGVRTPPEDHSLLASASGHAQSTGIHTAAERAEYAPMKDQWEMFFDESEDGRYYPRNIFIDLDPDSVDKVMNGDSGALYDPERGRVTWKEDASSNFARGQLLFRNLSEQADNKVRKAVEKCDMFAGFMTHRCIEGGTGSGAACSLLQRLAHDYRKKYVIDVPIVPSDTLGSSTVAPYNCVLDLQTQLDHTTISLVMDNEQLYRLSKEKLGMDEVSFRNLNCFASKAESALTCTMRFPNELSADLHSFMTNIHIFPRIHYFTVGMSPIGWTNHSIGKSTDTKITIPEILKKSMTPSNFLVGYPDWDGGPFGPTQIVFRGNQATPMLASKAAHKGIDDWDHLDWLPSLTGGRFFKIGVCRQNHGGWPSQSNQRDYLDPTKLTEEEISRTSVVSIANCMTIRTVFSERMAKKFDYLYSLRAFVHHYVSEGMEEGDLTEAREDIGFLLGDYEQIIYYGV